MQLFAACTSLPYCRSFCLFSLVVHQGYLSWVQTNHRKLVHWGIHVQILKVLDMKNQASKDLYKNPFLGFYILMELRVRSEGSI
jgi:hypothetical protein